MTELDQQQLKSENAQTQVSPASGLKGDFAQGTHREPVKNGGPDFARGERTLPGVDEGWPDYARGERTLPAAPEGPDYARGLRGKMGAA
jgi:hypothetical protein